MTTIFGTTITGHSILFSLPDGIIAGLFLYAILWLLNFSKKKQPLKRSITLALLFACCGAIFALTIPVILPGAWNMSTSSTKWVLSNINFSPLESTLLILHNALEYDNLKEFVRVCGGNFALLAPLGVLVPLLNEKYRLIRITVLAMGVSLSIELMQLMGNLLYGGTVRTVEIDDVILNTLGCVTAYLIFAIIRKMYRYIKRRSH